MDLFISILVGVIAALIVLLNVINFIYKRIKKIPSGDCYYCYKNSKKLLKEYRKLYK